MTTKPSVWTTSPWNDSYSDPVEAARAILSGPPDASGRSHRACDAATDGTHVIEDDGTVREVPPWGRWPIRAANWLAVQPSRGTIRRPDTADLRLYHEIRPIRKALAVNLRSGLEPLTGALGDAISCTPYRRERRAGDDADHDGFDARAARAIWTLKEGRGLDASRAPRPDDPGVRWLLDNHCAYEDDEARRPLLTGWLNAATGTDVSSRGPAFNENYCNVWTEPTSNSAPTARYVPLV